MKPIRPVRTSLLASGLLLLALPVSAATLTWDITPGTVGAGDSAITGGSSTWDTTLGNWTSDAGATNVAWNNSNFDIPAFGGTAGTVTLGTAVSVGGMSFDTAGYTLASNTITFAGLNPTITANADATISSSLAGTDGLVKAGSGILTIIGADTFTGGTSVSGGTLQIGNGVANGTVAGSYYVASGSTLRLARSAKTTVTNNSITGDGTVSLFVTGTPNGSANYQWDAFHTFDPAFTGTLRIEGGRVYSTPANLGNTTTIDVRSTGQMMLFNTSGVTYTQNFLLAGNGYGEAGQPGALRWAGGITATVTGSIGLTGDATIYSQSGGSNGTMTGPITGAFQADFNANTSATLTITPAVAVQNSYASTKISGAGIVTAGNAFALSTGPLTVNAGTLRLNGSDFTFANLSGTGGTIANNHATNASTITIGTDNTSTSYAGSFANGAVGLLNLTKTGTGTLSLTGGTRTLTGVTTVNGGALLASSGAYSTSAVTVNTGATFGGAVTAGAVTVNAGGILQAGYTGAGNLTATDLTFGGSSTLNVLALSPTTANVAVSGTVTTAGTETINVGNTTPPAIGTYRLISYGSIAGSGAGAFTLGTTPAQGTSRLRTYALDTSNPLFTTLTVGGDSALWSGAVNGAWDTSTSNWKLASDGTTTTTYFNADVVAFTDAATTKSLTINGADVTPGVITFNNSTGNDYVVGGTFGIAGAGSLTKSGTGKLTFSGGNHGFTGALTVTNGTLSIPTINNASAAGMLGNSATAVTLGDTGGLTGTLEYTGTGTTGSSTKTFVLATGGTGAVSVTNAASTLTLSGVISGSGSFLKSGPGTLVTSATNTYTGNFSITGGVLQVATLPTGTGTSSTLGAGSAFTLDGGTLRYNGTVTVGTDANPKFSRAITIGAGGGSLDQFGTANFVFISSTVTGSGPLNILCTSGTNKQWLWTGNSVATFSGPVFIGNGSAGSGHLQLRSGGQVGTGTITLNGGGFLGTDTGSATTINNNLVFNGGTIGTNGVGTTFTGTVTANAGTTSFLSPSGSQNIILNGNISGSGNITETGSTFSVGLGGNNSGYTGLYTHTAAGATFFNTAASASASARWATTAGRIVANMAGSNTFSLGALSGSGGFIGNLVAGSTATFSIGALNTDTSYAGTVINNTGTTALTKVGTGTLTLTNAGNTFTGATSVSGGRLTVNGAITVSPVTVNSGAILAGTGTVSGGTTVSTGGIIEGGSGGSGKLTLSTLTYSGTGTVAVGTLSNYAAAPAVQVSTSGGLTASGGAGSVTISVANLGTASAGNTYKLIGYSGAIGGGFSSFVLAPLPGRVSGTLVDNVGSVDLTIGSTPVSVIYTGATNANWDAVTSNWKLASDSSATTFQTADNLIFDDTAAPANTTLALSATVAPSSLTVGNSSLNYAFQGAFPISVAGSLTKTGTGSLTFSNGASSFGTAVSLGGGNVIFNGGATTFSSTLAVAGSNTTFSNGANSFQGAVSVNGGSFVLNSAASTLGSTLDVNSGSAQILTGGHTLSGNITVSGGSLTVASNANVLGSNLVINSGSVTLQGTGNNLGGSALTVKGNGTYVFPEFNGTGQSGPLGSSATVTLGDAGGVAGTLQYTGATTVTNKPIAITSGGTGVIQIDQAGATVTHSGVISGATGSLTKTGPGTLVLTATSTFTGGVTINGGAISMATFTNAANSPIGAGTTIAFNGGTLIYTGGNTGSDAAPNFTRAMTIGASGATLDLTAGFVHYNGTFSGTGTFTINSTGLTGVNAKQLLMEGNSPLFDGEIVINGAAQLRNNNANTLGSAVGSTTINATGLLAADNGAAAVNVTIPENINLNGGYFGVQNGSMGTTGALNILAASQIGHAYTGYSAGILTLSGAITGSAALTLNGNGADPLVSVGSVKINGAGPNSFSGALRITKERAELGVTTGPAFASTAVTVGDATLVGSRGVIRLIASEQIPDAAILTFDNQGTSSTVGDFGYLELNGFNETIGGLSDATTRGVVEVSEATSSLTSALTLAPATGQTYTYAGYLRNSNTGTGDSLSLVKNGPGTQVLSGANINYTGATTVNEGSLRLSDTTAFASNLTLNPPGVLELVRSATNWTFSRTVNGSGSVSVAAGAGTITLAGGGSFDGGTTVSSGTVILASGSALGTGPVTLSGATLDLNGQTLVDLNEISVSSSSTVTGTGSFTVTGSLPGTLVPGGSSAGRITTDNALALTSSSIVNLQLGGTTRHNGATGTYDTLQVTGAVTLAGTINVSLSNGFVPVGGQSFQLVGATSFAGTASLNLPTLTGTLIWDTSAFATTGVISVDGVGGYAQSFGLSGADALPGADPDKDGISNALEYALGINPTLNNAAEYRGVASSSAGLLQLTYRRPLGGVGGVTYGVEYKTTDLVVGNTGWTAAAEGAGANEYSKVVTPNGDGTTETVVITLNVVGAKKFARISVTY